MKYFTAPIVQSLLISVALHTPVEVLAQGTSTASSLPFETQPESAEEVVKRLTKDLLRDLSADGDLKTGDPKKIRALLDKKALAHIDLAGMTEATLGSARWRRLSSVDRRELSEQYFQLLIVQYASHLYRIKSDSPITIRTVKSSSDAAELEAMLETTEGKSEIRFRLRKHGGTWKINDLSVLGVWFVQLFGGQFESALRRGGIDGLIAELASKNQGRAASSKTE